MTSQPQNSNTASQLCFELVKHFEGCKLSAYKDVTGTPTVGYGTVYYSNGTKVKMGDKITQAQADAMLEEHLNTFFKQVAKAAPNANQHQLDSLTAFAYNCGMGNLKSSTLLKKVNASAPISEIKAEFIRWNKSKGVELAGLTRRRKAEAYLFETGTNKFEF